LKLGEGGKMRVPTIVGVRKFLIRDGPRGVVESRGEVRGLPPGRGRLIGSGRSYLLMEGPFIGRVRENVCSRRASIRPVGQNLLLSI